MDKMQPIGVLDSGVGGLSVLKCLHQMLPHEDFIYVGDTARTPYGTRSEQEIRGFVGEIIDSIACCSSELSNCSPSINGTNFGQATG